MGFISAPFGSLLFWLNNLVGNYGLALIIFTVLVRIILLPLTVKQQKSMQEMQKINPELAKIKEKYKNDKDKLNEEMMKLYKEHNVNPAGGCLPVLIQFPIIIGLYQVIIKPLTYMFKLAPEKIAELTVKVNEVLAAGGKPLIDAADYNGQIMVAQSVNTDILNSVGLGNITPINFNFLGINLGDTPSMSLITALWVIPVLAAVTTYLSTKISMAQTNNTSDDQTAATMKTMNMIFPFMTAWFAFKMPAGVGLYWIMGNIIQIVQQYSLNRYFKSKPAENPLVIEKEHKPNKGGGKKNEKRESKRKDG
ncbi:MAG: Membrane protein insertase YidC [Firmicutes bacterium ADurb.Bin193]|nr:MAG: Membrane protein insertase YidC [Firmicutes bacterium ADurb.Bin193]